MGRLWYKAGACLACLALIGGMLTGCDKKAADAADPSSSSVLSATGAVSDSTTSVPFELDPNASKMGADGVAEGGQASLQAGSEDSRADDAIANETSSSDAAGGVQPPSNDPPAAEDLLPPADQEPQPEDNPSLTPGDDQPEQAVNQISVVFSVDCRTAVSQGYQAAIDIASDGNIIAETVVVLDRDATVYDLLTRCGLEVDAKKTITGAYVSAIQGLREKDCGAGSGWMYSVNGTFPGKSCDKYTLRDGDVVSWRYTCSNGSDLR